MPRRHGLLLSFALGFTFSLALLGGCEINEPALPTFTTQVTVPLGEERLDVIDALDGEAYLSELDGNTLGFTVSGDPDTVSLDFDLAADISPQVIDESLGDFAITLTAPLDFGFSLGELYPPVIAFQGLTVPVPPFPIVQTSDSHDIEDLESATLSRGTLTVSVHNGLPVPVSAASGPDQLVLDLVDPASGQAFTTVTFDAIGPGADAVRIVDLAGVELPGATAVRLAGGSPGSGGALVTVDSAVEVAVHAEFTDLAVSHAVAVIGPQEMSTTITTELPADYAVTEALIESGGTTLTATNEMAIGCQAVIVWPQVVDLDDRPLTAAFDLGPHATLTRSIDFASHIVRAPAGTALTALTAEITVSSPGSLGLPVSLAADEGVRADLAAGTIRFGSVTGTLPEVQYALDPVDEEIDLPEELAGLQLTTATLTLEIENSASVAAETRFQLTGTSAAQSVRTLDVRQDIVPADDRSAVTTITLDETNSTIVDFLNNLPTRITLAGDVHVPAGTTGTVHAHDWAAVRWRIVAPVEIIVTDSWLYGDPKELDLDADARNLLRDHAGSALADLEVLNHLPLGVEMRVLFSADSTTIKTDPLVAIGPIQIAAATRDPQTHTVSEPVLSRPQFGLTAEQTRLLGTEGLFSVLEIHLPDSAGEAARVLTTDYVTVQGLIRLDVNVSDD